MDKYYVYMYLRANKSEYGESGSPYYVGKGTGYRAISTNHRVLPPRNRSLIVYALKEVCESDAHVEESRLIALHGRIDLGTGCLRNWTNGGEGASGNKVSDETKLKHSVSRKGVPKPPRSEMHRQNARLAQLGKKQSPETIEKRIAPLRGRKRAPYSAEWCANISKGQMGREAPKSAFKLGMTPWNKDKTGYMGANTASFKAGFTPWNAGKTGVMGIHWTKLDKYKNRFKKSG